LNLVTAMTTLKSLAELSSDLKQIESQQGRIREAKKYSSRSLDIDIMTYDDYSGIQSGIELPRPEVMLNAYVLRPFAELAPQLVLPGSKDTLEELWQSFNQASQPLVEVALY